MPGERHEAEGITVRERKGSGGAFNTSLSEMQATPPCRRFVFVDWEEESNRHCEVVARDIASRNDSGFRS